MQTESASNELLCIYSEPLLEECRFAIGFVPKAVFTEVRSDYLEPILVNRFPLNLLYPESVVHMVDEAPLSKIVSAFPRREGVFVAVLPRRISVLREGIEQVLRQEGFAPLNELPWRWRRRPGTVPQSQHHLGRITGADCCLWLTFCTQTRYGSTCSPVVEGEVAQWADNFVQRLEVSPGLNHCSGLR